MKAKEGGWLEKRIREAQEEVKRWPQWMRDASRFEGSRETNSDV